MIWDILRRGKQSPYRIHSCVRFRIQRSHSWIVAHRWWPWSPPSFILHCFKINLLLAPFSFCSQHQADNGRADTLLRFSPRYTLWPCFLCRLHNRWTWLTLERRVQKGKKCSNFSKCLFLFPCCTTCFLYQVTSYHIISYHSCIRCLTLAWRPIFQTPNSTFIT